MRRITKPLSLLLALVMAFGLLPVTALAAESETASVTVASTGSWDDYSETAGVSLPFGKSGNKVKVWTDGVGINISAIAVDGVESSLTDTAVEVQDAVFEDGVIKNLHNDGSYAVIDLDELGFGDLSGTRNVAFTYATERDDFELHTVSSFDEVQPLAEASEPAAESTTESTTEASEDPEFNEAPADAEQDVAEYAGASYKKVTVTGIATTGGWNSTSSTQKNWFEITDVQLDPDGDITVRSGDGNGINISAIEINNKTISVTQMRENRTVSVAGNDSAGNPVDLENADNSGEYQIAYLNINGVSATIKLGQFGLTASGSNKIRFYYAIKETPATLVVESSVGSGDGITVAYNDITHGNPGGTVTPPSGEGHPTDPRREIKGGDKTTPKKATWFFDSHGEVKSFNKSDKPDTYEDRLKDADGKQNEGHRNNLTLYSSTDGSIRKAENGGELWVNWENQYRASEPNVNDDLMKGGDYTDGSYTIVGWGGDFYGDSDLAKNAIRLQVKDNGDGTLADALSHLTIYLVESDGTIEDKIWVKSATGDDASDDSLHYAGTTNDGYYTFEATLNSSHKIQGIKLAFDRYSHSGSHQENSVTHHSGTLIIGNVEIQVNNEWKDFGPFDYYEDNSYYENPYKSPVVSGSRPFLRSGHFQSTLKEGAHEGYNLANKQTGYGWHIWTMSTSDANIVNNNYSSADALQIKYSNTDSHRTYTRLVGETELNGEWLVMTLGGEVDAGTKFQLVNSNEANATGDAITAPLSLSNFRTTKDDNGTEVTAELFKDNQYHTIYYHMQGETFKSVYVDFTDVYDKPGDASRYMYITEIYLLEPAAKIEKEVDKPKASTGDELKYTLTVTNNDDQPIIQFTVTDELPKDVTFVSSSSPEAKLEADGRTITWNYTGNLAANESATLTITVRVNTDFQGTLYNSATITSLNSRDVSIVSNRVSTVVITETPAEFVFYAEVGQKTTLPIALGSTAETRTETDEETGRAESVLLEKTTNADGSNTNYKTVTGEIELVSTGSIKISTEVPGGISLNAITLDGDESILWMDNKQTQFGSDVGVVGVEPGDYFNKDDLTGPGELKNLQKGYILIKNVAQGKHTVTFKYRSWGNNLLQLTPITTKTVTVIGEPVKDTVASVPASSDNGAEINVNGITGQNSGSLFYTNKSKNAGVDTFKLTYNPGGDTTQTKEAMVTVYNYKVDNQIYVLDYGLPVNLTGGKSGFLNEDKATLKLENDNTGYAFAGLRSQAEGKRNTDTVADEADYATPYGGETVEGANGVAKWSTSPSDQSLSVTFTPTTFMSSVDTFYYGVQVSKNNTYPSDATNATPVMEGQIKVMPANVVYYEDNFSQSGTTEANGVNGIIYTGANSISKNGETFEWQTNDQDSLYGYDEDAYTEVVGKFSNGSAHELEIGAKASFTFKGTGFDIIGRTNNATGILMATIYTRNEDKWVSEGFIVVDTYYENGDLYQIPVISVLDLGYGEHLVKLFSLKGYADEYGEAGGKSTVFIDGVRIYNPLGEGGNKDYKEEEQGAKFMEVKGMIFGENFEYDRDNPEDSRMGDEDKSMATLIKFVKYGNEDLLLNGATLVEILKNRNDSTDTVSQEPGRTFDLLTYAFSGPNKELYLENDYGFGFAPERTNAEEPATLQIGVKLVSRPANTSLYPTIEYLDRDGNWQTLREVRSATEKYYSLDDLLTDRVNKLYGEGEWVVLRVNDNRSGAVVSVTNVKYKNYTFEPLGTDKEENATPEFAHDDIKVRTGYDTRNNTFKTGSISMSVQTKIDITEVRVYSDEEGTTQMTLLTMAYRDSSQDDATVRTWTIKFKGTEKQKNYWLQIVDQYGNVSKLVAAK